MRDDAMMCALIAGFDRPDATLSCAGTIRRRAAHDVETFTDAVDVNPMDAMRVAVAARPRDRRR